MAFIDYDADALNLTYRYSNPLETHPGSEDILDRYDSHGDLFRKIHIRWDAGVAPIKVKIPNSNYIDILFFSKIPNSKYYFDYYDKDGAFIETTSYALYTTYTYDGVEWYAAPPYSAKLPGGTTQDDYWEDVGYTNLVTSGNTYATMDFVKILQGGSPAPEGRTQTIPVEWLSPYNAATFSDSFDIIVHEASTESGNAYGNEGGFEGGGSEHGF